MKKYRKKPVDRSVRLGDYPIYSDKIYRGREPMKVVGIRQNEIELKGDYSGGTHNVIQKDWHPIGDCFFVEKLCEEEMKPNGCQVHNVHCCGGSKIITNHIQYWEE